MSEEREIIETILPSDLKTFFRSKKIFAKINYTRLQKDKINQ